MDIEIVVLMMIVGALCVLGALAYNGRKRRELEKLWLEKQEEEATRAKRLFELRAAYEVAKDELKREPTVDEIFSARDMMRSLPNGED